jgi:hypothetical protein
VPEATLKALADLAVAGPTHPVRRSLAQRVVAPLLRDLPTRLAGIGLWRVHVRG